jgi:Zn-dependent protease
MRGWSWKLGRVAGIDVYIHGTFLILLAWVGLSHYLERHRWSDAGAGVVFVLTLFGIVVLHELGHALTARHYGIRTRDITLLPIGGVARLERMPDEPKQELLVAFAGPAVNVALAALLFALEPAATSTAVLGGIQQTDGGILAKLAWVNAGLAGFNLIPAFPMDGGRVLRALLAMRMDYVKATNVAAEIGRGLALMFGLLGLFTNPFLVFIALFVWMGATAEAGMVQLKSALGSIPVNRVMITQFETLAPTDTLQRAMDHVLAGFQHDFPVLEAGRVIGVLTRADLVKGLSERGREAPVATVMTPSFETAESSEMAEGAFQRLQSSRCPALPVLQGDRLVGVLTLENIGEFLTLQSALRGNGKADARGRRSA